MHMSRQADGSENVNPKLGTFHPFFPGSPDERRFGREVYLIKASLEALWQLCGIFRQIEQVSILKFHSESMSDIFMVSIVVGVKTPENSAAVMLEHPSQYFSQNILGR